MQSSIIELRVVLYGIKPSVYRTIQIQASATFYHLHMALQEAFGWHDGHLHSFMLDGEEIGMNEFNEFEEDEVQDEHSIHLSKKLFREKQKFIYLYDFGDNWKHQITVTKFIEAKEGTFYPRCVRGARNTPPEDCGGIWGFEEFKKIMSDKNHPEYEEMKEWYGGEYDSDHFSKEVLNERYKMIFSRS